MEEITYTLNRLHRNEQQVIIFITIVAIVAICVIGMVAIMTPKNPCRWNNTATQACIDYRFDQCMATNQYTRLECAIMIGDR